jgi:hypothetical protein
MKFRFHRGTLAESLKTVCEISSKAELLAILTQEFGFSIRDEMVSIELYVYDNRIDWNTHIVTIRNYGVAGFTDGLLT